MPPNSGQVQSRNGRLYFPELGRELDQDTGLARAKKLLEIARSESASRMTFGGRVIRAGIDPSASLRNYYTSLRLAKLLAEEHDLPDAVQTFAGTVSIPEDLRPLLEQAIGAKSSRAIEAEPALPLGNKTATSRQSLIDSIRQNLHAALEIDDQTLRTLIPNSWW